jgi:zinc transport system substrate-binding protein
MHRENAFLAGRVRGLCGGASSSPAAKRPAARRVARVSVLRSALFAFVVLCAAVVSAQTAKPVPALKIGVTLHPYYSWTANVVGNLPGYEVRALLPGDIDAGDYQPRPQDIKRLADLDVIIVNGIGHDDFIFSMLKASGNTRAAVVRVNAETPVIRATRGSGVNSHTFISFSNAIQQTYAIQRALARLRPQDAGALSKNAAEYARRLRGIKAQAASRLADATITRVVTVHDGYGYLLQEFGLEVAGVVQPSHGLTPSAGELRNMVALLKREQITVVFSEETFPEPLLKVLRDEAGVSVFVISHIASGPFTPDKFEREMQENAETMIRALVR